MLQINVNSPLFGLQRHSLQVRGKRPLRTLAWPKLLAFTLGPAAILLCELLLGRLRTLLYTATILISFSGAQSMCKAASKDKTVDAKLYTSSYFLTKR